MDDGRGARRIAQVAGLSYVFLLGVLLLVPWGSVPSRGLGLATEVAARIGLSSALVDPTRVEFVANILVFVPAVIVGASWRADVAWSAWTAYGFVISLGVEAIQAVALPDRSATFADVVANTAGALIGAVVVAGFGHRHRPAQPPTRGPRT